MAVSADGSVLTVSVGIADRLANTTGDTFLTTSAIIGSFAVLHAESLDTLFTVRATVPLALEVILLTGDERISIHSFRAEALALVVGGLAFGALSASGCGAVAGIGTLTFDTSFVVLALAVP